MLAHFKSNLMPDISTVSRVKRDLYVFLFKLQLYTEDVIILDLY